MTEEYSSSHQIQNLVDTADMMIKIKNTNMKEQMQTQAKQLFLNGFNLYKAEREIEAYMVHHFKNAYNGVWYCRIFRSGSIMIPDDSCFITLYTAQAGAVHLIGKDFNND